MTRLDSITNATHSLQLKVDSLQRVVQKTEIGTGFFTEIVSLQLAIFLVIIGLGGWISWSQIIKILRKDHQRIIDQTNLIVEDQKAILAIEISDLRFRVLRTSFNVAASLYTQYSTTTDVYAFLWAISAASSDCERNSNTTEVLEWLDLATMHLEKLDNTHLKPIKNITSRLEEHFKIINTLNDEGVFKKIDEIRDKAYSLIYNRN